MIKYLAALGGVGLIFTLYEITMYGITKYILDRSASLKTDFWWCLALALPFAVLELIWLKCWRIGEGIQLSPWAVDIMYLVCAIIGSSIAMLLFFKETPTYQQLIGLVLVLIGGIIAVWK